MWSLATPSSSAWATWGPVWKIQNSLVYRQIPRQPGLPNKPNQTKTTTKKQKNTTKHWSQAWWLTPVIPALQKLEQEDCHELKTSLDYRKSSCIKRCSHKKVNSTDVLCLRGLRMWLSGRLLACCAWCKRKKEKTAFFCTTEMIIELSLFKRAGKAS